MATLHAQSIQTGSISINDLLCLPEWPFERECGAPFCQTAAPLAHITCNLSRTTKYVSPLSRYLVARLPDCKSVSRHCSLTVGVHDMKNEHGYIRTSYSVQQTQRTRSYAMEGYCCLAQVHENRRRDCRFRKFPWPFIGDPAFSVVLLHQLCISAGCMRLSPICDWLQTQQPFHI